MIHRIVFIVFPLFAVVAAGFFYARWTKPDMAAANRMNMEVFLPALIFTVLAGKASTWPIRSPSPQAASWWSAAPACWHGWSRAV